MNGALNSTESLLDAKIGTDMFFYEQVILTIAEASKCGSLEIVELLIGARQKLDVKKRDLRGRMPLHYAVIQARLDVAPGSCLARL